MAQVALPRIPDCLTSLVFFVILVVHQHGTVVLQRLSIIAEASPSDVDRFVLLRPFAPSSESLLVLLLIQLREHIFAESLLFDELAKAVEEIELEIGHLLFGHAECGGHFLIRGAANEHEFHALDFLPIALGSPMVDLFGEATGEGLFLQLAAFAATGNAAGGTNTAGHVPRTVATGAGGGKRQGGPPPLAAQMVGKFVGRNGEQVTFERPAGVVVRQAGKKPDECFLHNIFARSASSQPAIDEGKEASFILGNERIPGLRLAGTNPLDKQCIGVRRGRCRSGHGAVRLRNGEHHHRQDSHYRQGNAQEQPFCIVAIGCDIDLQ